jgi:hypothetical protein
MSRTYKDQRQFERKQDHRTKRHQDKMPLVENDNHYDVLQSFTPNDWSNY